MSQKDPHVDRIRDRVGSIIRSSYRTAQTISLFPVSRRAGRMIFKAETPEASYCVKSFSVVEDKDARLKLKRELVTLHAASGSGLTPEFIGYDADDNLLVMAWVDGPTLAERLEDELSHRAGINVGNWFAQFSSLMPNSDARGSWSAYLSNYSEFGTGAALHDRLADLDAMPLLKLGIAKNDGHLDNFIWPSNRTLVGIDFADARRKPLGWDVLLTARSLVREFGVAAKPVIDGMVMGWCEVERMNDKAEFGELVRHFLQALEIQSHNASDSD